MYSTTNLIFNDSVTKTFFKCFIVCNSLVCTFTPMRFAVFTFALYL